MSDGQATTMEPADNPLVENSSSPTIMVRLASRSAALIVAYILARLILFASRGIALIRRSEQGGLPNNLSWETSWLVSRDNPVRVLVNTRLANTLVLIIATLICAAVLAALAILILRALHRMHQGQAGITPLILGLLGRVWAFHRLSAPAFWMSFFLFIVFAFVPRSLGLPALPTGGVISLSGPLAGTLPDRILHLLLPLAVLVPLPAYLTARAVSATLDHPVDEADRSRTMLAAILTGASILVGQIGGILSAALISEIVFAYNGVGRLFFDAIFRLDLPLVLAALVAFTSIVFVFRLIADLLAVLAEHFGQPARSLEPPSELQERAARFQRRVILALMIVPGIIAVLAFLAPVLSVLGILPDPRIHSPELTFQPIGSPGHLLGTDEIGRDLGSRLLFGTRNSLLVALAGALLAVVLGSISGVLSGVLSARKSVFAYLVRELVLVPADAFLMLPLLPALFYFVLLFHSESSISTAIFGIGILLSVRMVRPLAAFWAASSESNMINRKRLIGFASILLGGWFFALLAIAPLSFLGLGISLPAPSLGNMLTRVQDYMFLKPSLAFWPGLILWGLTFSLYSLAGLVGNRSAQAPNLHWLNQ